MLDFTSLYPFITRMKHPYNKTVDRFINAILLPDKMSILCISRAEYENCFWLTISIDNEEKSVVKILIGDDFSEHYLDEGYLLDYDEDSNLEEVCDLWKQYRPSRLTMAKFYEKIHKPLYRLAEATPVGDTQCA